LVILYNWLQLLVHPSRKKKWKRSNGLFVAVKKKKKKKKKKNKKKMEKG